MKKFIFGLVLFLSVLVYRTDYVSALTSDFVISNFSADYYLDKDSDGRSTLKTVEAITADFPAIDQNHGIERVLPMKYDGHSTSLKVQSVKDASGADVGYSTDTQNDNLVLRIGSADVYVHGKTNYVITYTQRDVTRFFKDTGSDEFYWDVNGTGWSQPFDGVSARLYLGSGLSDSLTGNLSCYYGALNSTNKCVISKDGDVISTTPVKLGVGENVTIAVGFKQGTFAAYSMSLIETIGQYIVFIELMIAIVLVSTIVYIKIAKDKGAPGRGIIIAEYLPPPNDDVITSSIIKKCTTTWSAATIISLAVCHKIQISDNGEEKARKKVYTLKLLSVDGLSPNERLVLEAFFGSSLLIGNEYQVQYKKVDKELADKISEAYDNAKLRIKSDGYYAINKKATNTMGVLVSTIIAQAALIGFIFRSNELNLVLIIIIAFLAFFLGVVIMNARQPLSAKGRELSDYLDGLKMYIKIAEADRIKVLQSPEGADRQPVDTSDTAAVLRLYERVLPYAVLFGIEKEWTETLGKYYEQQNTTPDWYVGSGAFNSIMFASAMSSFSTSVAASSTYTSSSSGGSSGGGFSGGGGW